MAVNKQQATAAGGAGVELRPHVTRLKYSSREEGKFTLPLLLDG